VASHEAAPGANPGAGVPCFPRALNRAAAGADVTVASARGVSTVVKPDDELIRDVRSGETAAFEALVERYYPTCLRFAERQLGQREDAEEAVQDALLRAFRALRRGAVPARFRPWLLRIVVNRCRTMGARRTRHRRLFERWVTWQDADGQRVVAPADVASDPDPALTAALAALSPKLREAFLLRHVEELDYREMATVTGTRPSALKMRVKRAAEQLLRALEGDGGRVG
jgi:RNA polymerase sigma-70 factor, ECF subfamily